MKTQAHSTKEIREDVLAAGLLGLEALRAAPDAGVQAALNHPGFVNAVPQGEGVIAGINPDGLKSAVALELHMPQISGAVTVNILPGKPVAAQVAPALAGKGVTFSAVPASRRDSGMKG